MKTTIIEGPRQSGKTTMLREYLKYVSSLNSFSKIAVYAPHQTMLVGLTSGLVPINTDVYKSSAMSTYIHHGFKFNTVIIDNLEYCNSKFIAQVLINALIYDSNLVITIEQGKWANLSEEVAELLDACIMKSEELVNQ
jgi:hypothetical protein